VPGGDDRRTPTIKLDEEQSIAVRELDATAYPALQSGRAKRNPAAVAHNSLRGERGLELCNEIDRLIAQGSATGYGAAVAALGTYSGL
jgi:hypothetical protein